MSPLRGARLRRRLAIALIAGWTGACGAIPPSIDLQFLDAPDEVRSRGSLPSCGVELVGRGAGFNLPARQCFWDAYTSGQPAEFITTRPAPDGRPLVAIFRSLGDGRAEFFVDESAIWGSPVWTWATCDALTATEDPAVAVDWIPGGPDDPCDEHRLAR